MKLDAETREGTVMLIKAIIGAAALVFPRCYQRAGIIPATVALLIAGWAGIVVGDLLMETRRALGPKVSTFREMGVAAIGSRWGGVLLDATVTLQSFGTLVGYVVAVGDLVSGSLRKWHVPELIEVPSFISSIIFYNEFPRRQHAITIRAFSVLSLSLFVFFPLCLLKRLESLRSLAASTMFIYCFFLLFKECVSRVVLGDLHISEDLVMPSAPLNWVNGGMSNMFRVLPIIALSYSCVPLMIEVRRTLERRIASRHQVDSAWRVVSVLSFASSGFFYIATGLLGYVAFRGSTSANVLSNLENLGWIATLVNTLFAASLIVSYPLICFVVREPVRRVLFWLVSFVTKDEDEDVANSFSNQSNDLEKGSDLDITRESENGKDVLKSPEGPPLALFVLEAALVTSATMAAAISFPGIDVVLELIGGTAAVFVSYIAPVSLFFLVKPESTFQRDRWKALAIGVSGCLIGVLTCYNLYSSMRGGAPATANTPPPLQLPVKTKN